MADWSNLNGQRIIQAKITIPYYGIWIADVVLASSSLISVQVSLTFSDVTLVGNVYRQFSYASSRSARLVGGYGGWQKTIGPFAYNSPSGVLLGSVLGDLATAAGEQIAVPVAQNVSIGTSFVIEKGPSMRALRQLAAPIWWVDSTGITRIVDRTVLAYTGNSSDNAKKLGPVASPFQVIEWSGMKGKFTIASETLSDWMPGRTFSDFNITTPQVISNVTHTFDLDGTARTQVLTTP